jgi:hypothetical protein
MESGLDCGYAPGERELELMKRSPDFVRFALSLPMRRDPGWGDSHLLPEDAAKIGYLYLRGGQSLIVWPDLDTVVVILAGGNPGRIAGAVRQAIQSDRPLAPNPEACRRMLARAARAAQEPQPEPASEVPALAAGISGVVYDFPVNASRLDALSLEFRAPGEARVLVKYQGEDLTFPVGLDGRYRRGPYGPFHLLAGAMGKWTSPNEFLLDLNFIANINHYTLRLRFEGDHLEMTANEASGLIRDGRITGTRRPAQPADR